MAKNGLKYYNSDTDRFNDPRILRLVNTSDFGMTGYVVYEFLLNEIYRQDGYFLPYNEDALLGAAIYWRVSEKVVHDIAEYCIKIGLFDKEQAEKNHILTSKSIQERYSAYCKRYGKTPDIHADFYLIHPVEVTDGGNYRQETEPTVATTGRKNEDRIRDNNIKEEKEEKESVKKKDAAAAAITDQEECEVAECESAENTKSAGGKIVLAPPKQTIAEMQAARKKREKVFYDSLVQYVEQYGRDMIRAFFDYWSEPNKSGTKMRFEMQPTFELSRRLATWARRNESQTPIHNGNGITTPATKQRNPKFADFGETMEAIRLGIGAGLAERDNLAGDGQ